VQEAPQITGEDVESESDPCKRRCNLLQVMTGGAVLGMSGQSLRESGYTLTWVNLALFQPCVAHVIGANYSVGQLVTLAEAFSYVISG